MEDISARERMTVDMPIQVKMKDHIRPAGPPSTRPWDVALMGVRLVVVHSEKTPACLVFVVGVLEISGWGKLTLGELPRRLGELR